MQPSEASPEDAVAPPGPDVTTLPAGAEGRYRSAMLRRFGLLYYLSGLWWIVRGLRLEEHSAENVRQAAAKGPVVYVLHARSRMDWLALNAVLKQRRLPLARFTNGVRSAWLAPVAQGLQLVLGSLSAWWRQGKPADPIASGWLSEAVAAGMPTALFLLDDQGEAVAQDPMSALVQAQARSERPIQLVPVVVVWRRNWERARTEVGRLLLGGQERPSVLQKVMAVSTRHRDAFVQAGEPVDLRELLDHLRDQPVDRQVRLARVLLRRYLYRESRVVHGPRIRSHRWNRKLVASSPQVRRLVRDEAAATGRSPAAIQAQVEQVLDHVAARFSWPVVKVARVFTRVLWNRIYAGVDMRDVDVERIRAAYRDGATVLVPCHRSHLDYVLISSQLFERDVMIPHVVAGENLSFFPLGPVLRRVGAVFIKRSFSGDRVFPVVFSAYLRQLIRDEFPLEFFIEGGRSRTGKLLPPKLGVLSMVMDAAAEARADRRVTLLPVAISYEQIAEEGAYARELDGGRKQAEDLGQVVKAGKVVTKRYGRVFMRVGQPIVAGEVLAGLDKPWGELGREERQEVLSHVGEQLMNRIARNMVVLPTGVVAMALLAQSRRGVRLAELAERAHRLDELLRGMGAQSAGGRVGPASVEQALARFEKEKQVKRLRDEDGDILQVVPEKRVTLEYYKNGLINYLVGPALLATAVRGAISPEARDRGEHTAPAEVVFVLFRLQAWLLRYEFSLDPDVGLDQVWTIARGALERHGAIEPLGPDQDAATAPLVVAHPALLTELSELTRNFLESYQLVLRAARGLRARDIPLGELPARVQQVGRGLLAVDELRRPEALSLVNLANAVRAYREEGVIQVRSDGGGLQLDEAALETYGQALGRLLS
ncbi:1-acyl-sn-glycerol-3-phosphate acyltransferase [Myxococcota bacterium]|nr:1-acyl-sn-glycerol-3-phosphate acyltransferase [Myxococcota bacterium]